MADQKRTNNEAAKVGDTVQVILRGPDGEVKREMSGAEVRVVAARLDTREQLLDQKADKLRSMLKDHGVTMPANAPKDELIDVLASRRGPLGINEILFEGTPHEIKGPGPEWERDSEGNYVNR